MSPNEFGLIVSRLRPQTVSSRPTMPNGTLAHNIAIGRTRYSGNYSIDETFGVDTRDNAVNAIGYFYATVAKRTGVAHGYMGIYPGIKVPFHPSAG